MGFVGPSLLPVHPGSARGRGGCRSPPPSFARGSEVVQCPYIYWTQLGRKMLKHTELLTGCARTALLMGDHSLPAAPVPPAPAERPPCPGKGARALIALIVSDWGAAELEHREGEMAAPVPPTGLLVCCKTLQRKI